MSAHVEWWLAAGSCGFSVGDTPVEGAYVNGVALFVFAAIPDGYICVVTGQMTQWRPTADEAKDAGVDVALEWGTDEADRRLSRAAFDAIMTDPTRLPES